MMEAGLFLEHVATILGELRAAQATLGVKQEEANVLKQVMSEQGAAGIKAYFKIRKEAVSLRAKIAAGELKLEGFIESCKRKQRKEHMAKNWTDREEEAISE